MKSRLKIQPEHWPLLVIGLLILLVCGDISARFLTNSFPPGLIGCSLLLSVWGLLVLMRRSVAQNMLIFSVVSAVILIAAPSMIPGNGPIQLLSTALAFGIGTVVYLMNLKSPASPIESDRETSRVIQQQAEITIDESANPVIAPVQQAAIQPETVLQYWRRIKLDDGIERLEGSVTLKFAEGEKIQHFHLPISPAFTSLPQAWGESSDSSLRIDFNVLQTYGVRLTARRGSGKLVEESVEVVVTLESQPLSKAVA